MDSTVVDIVVVFELLSTMIAGGIILVVLEWTVLTTFLLSAVVRSSSRDGREVVLSRDGETTSCSCNS